MGQGPGFSFASVVLSYFLVGGGMFTAMLIAGFARVTGELTLYAMMAGGAFVGGFVAGRASRGETVLEPAIGAIGVIATVVGLAAGTEVGRLIWHVDSDGTMKFLGLVGGLAAGGALGGAWISERLLGESTASAAPWILYSALAAFGACLISTVVTTVILSTSSFAEAANANAMGTALIAGIALGCLLAGLAVGASARVRPILGAFVGGIAGTAGFAVLLARSAGGAGGGQDELMIVAMFASGGGIVTMIGAAVGWATVGKTAATAG